MPYPDPIGEIAHLLTGEIGRNCCYRTGGFNNKPDAPVCECRELAKALLENKARLREYLSWHDDMEYAAGGPEPK